MRRPTRKPPSGPASPSCRQSMGRTCPIAQTGILSVIVVRASLAAATTGFCLSLRASISLGKFWTAKGRREGLDANSLKARHAPAASFLSVRALTNGARSTPDTPEEEASFAVAVANSAAAEASMELAKKAADIAAQLREHA